MYAKSLWLSAVALIAVAAPVAAQSRKPIGSTVAVVNLVTAEFNRDTRTLTKGDKVNQNEKIEVGLDGSGELKFDDDTKLALGPGSRLTLDKFVYDPAKSSGSIVMNLAKGTFRFITGIASKPTYVIRTPVASITVRGTIFDLFIQDDGMVWLLLHEGAVQVCNDRGKCQELDEPGKLMRILGDGEVGSPVKWASLPGNGSVPFEKAFPFVIKAPSIDPTPIFTEDVIKLGSLTPPRKPRYEPEEKPTKKTERSIPPKESKKAEKPKKKTTTAKKGGSSYEENIVTGMDIAIGIGGGLGKLKGGGHRPPGGGGYPKGGSGMPKGGYGGEIPR
ncbi:MAG: FecR domain-containing protein [Hyphomicrobium sp.]|jgi:hypothetical protein